MQRLSGPTCPRRCAGGAARAPSLHTTTAPSRPATAVHAAPGTTSSSNTNRGTTTSTTSRAHGAHTQPTAPASSQGPTAQPAAAAPVPPAVAAAPAVSAVLSAPTETRAPSQHGHASASGLGSDDGQASQAQALGSDQQQGDPEQQQQPEYVEVEVTTETEEVVEDQGFQPRVAAQQAHSYLTTTTPGQAISVAAVGLVLASAGLWAYRRYQQYNTNKARRKRQLLRNQKLVKELDAYLPSKRDKLTPKFVKGLKNSTGFEPKEVFRKYMWYILTERKFDQDAVEDLLVLKENAGLTDEDVADAIAERAQRVYDKYGTLILNPEGFTSVGVARKEACRTLCQKVLFLAECNALVHRGTEAASKLNLRVIFGASEADLAKLRVASIADLGKPLDERDKLSDDELEELTPGDDAPPRTATDSM